MFRVHVVIGVVQEVCACLGGVQEMRDGAQEMLRGFCSVERCGGGPGVVVKHPECADACTMC